MHVKNKMSMLSLCPRITKELRACVIKFFFFNKDLYSLGIAGNRKVQCTGGSCSF